MEPNDTPDTGTVAPEKDTADTQSNETSGSENEAPAPPPEEKQTEEVKSADTAEQQLLAGKYKTPEELEKGYKELESKFGQETSEKAELTRILNEAFTAPEPDTAAAEVESADPKIEKIERDNAVLKFIVSHQDASPEDMKKVLSEDPMIAQITSHDAKLEYAYLKTQSLSHDKAVSDAKKEAQTASEAKRAEKEVAKVESAKSAEPVNEGAELMNKATSGTPDERVAARQALIRKHLINI